MPCRQSWLAIVPPPAPEPTTTTQSRSSRAMGRESIGNALPAPWPFVEPAISGLLDPRVGQPVEVVEAPLEVAALAEGLALPPEDRPHLGVVVEREDGLGAHRLEELCRAHAVQHLERRAAERVEVAQPLVELRTQPDVVGRGLEDGIRRALVRTVSEAVVREHRADHARQQRPLCRLDAGICHGATLTRVLRRVEPPAVDELDAVAVGV